MNDKNSILLVLKDNPSGVRIVHHNIQGLCSKFDELSLWFSNRVKTATIFALLKHGSAQEVLMLLYLDVLFILHLCCVTLVKLLATHI